MKCRNHPETQSSVNSLVALIPSAMCASGGDGLDGRDGEKWRR